MCTDGERETQAPNAITAKERRAADKSPVRRQDAVGCRQFGAIIGVVVVAVVVTVIKERLPPATHEFVVVVDHRRRRRRR
jgi:hypothetical protein